MNNLDLIQKFIKVARVIIIVFMSLCVAMALFCTAGLVLWVVCGNSYIWSLHYVVAYIMSLFSRGTYFGSIAFAATSVIVYTVRATLLYYGLRCCNIAIKAKSPFNRETYRSVFWQGIKVIIIPEVVMFLNVALFSYMGLAYKGAYIGGLLSLIIGVLLMALSLVLMIAVKNAEAGETEEADMQQE